MIFQKCKFCNIFRQMSSILIIFSHFFCFLLPKSFLLSICFFRFLGTNMLQPYMHGFFIDHKLHQKLKTQSQPFAFEEYKKKQVEERLTEKRKMRVKEKKKLGTNAQLKERLENAIAEAEGKQGPSAKRLKAAQHAKSVLQDDRFAKMFENPDFEIEKVKPGQKRK